MTQISICLVIQFVSSRYSTPAEAETFLQLGIISGDISIEDIRADGGTQSFRTIIAAEEIASD